MSHLIWHNSGTITARYTYSIIPSVQTKVLFPYNRDIGISYVRLLLHDSMLKDDSHRTGTSTSPICECGSDRENAEHFLFHCTQYQHIRKNGLYKPRTGHTGRTGRCMNHAPAILAAPALIYSTHRLVVWIIVVHFHLCSLLDRYTALEV